MEGAFVGRSIRCDELVLPAQVIQKNGRAGQDEAGKANACHDVLRPVGENHAV